MGADQQIERQRAFRVHAGREASLADVLQQHERSLRQMAKRAGGIGAAWAEVIPEALAGRTEIVSLKGGVLIVRVDDAATKFQIDRTLRRALRELEKKAGVALRRVRLVL